MLWSIGVGQTSWKSFKKDINMKSADVISQAPYQAKLKMSMCDIKKRLNEPHKLIWSN